MATPLLLDANLSILLAVGITNRSYIAKHKRLEAYDAIDFDIVCNLIARSSGVIFSPNVLSETSNLVRYVDNPIKSEIAAVLARMIAEADEQFVESRQAVGRAEYIRLGLTDSVLLTQATTGATLLTSDLQLYLAAEYARLSVINYNHIRDELREDFRA
jgi:hypothetical protein